MQALTFQEKTGLKLERDRPLPENTSEALIAVTLSGICSTDLEIIKGYVPGYNGVLGHEFVGIVKKCSANEALQGKRVVGEINCPLDSDLEISDPVQLRNHYPRRTVFGIIGRDGAMAQYTCLPASNLIEVPPDLSDEEAVFTEPLAAACRIIEQQVIKQQDKVVIVGDGKLGLLIAQLITLQTKLPPLHIGRHQEKLDLVQRTTKLVIREGNSLPESEKQAYDVCIEASGSSRGILMAMELTKPLGTVVQKSTCSVTGDPNMPDWSSIANDVVVNEKRLVGSRCGPFAPALEAMKHPFVKQLLARLVTDVYPLSKAIEAIERAKSKGALKVLISMPKDD